MQSSASDVHCLSWAGLHWLFLLAVGGGVGVGDGVMGGGGGVALLLLLVVVMVKMVVMIGFARRSRSTDPVNACLLLPRLGRDSLTPYP